VAIVFQLGFLLLELCTALEDQPSADNEVTLTTGTASAEFLASIQWWRRDAVKEEGEEYAETIRKCLCFDFSCESRSLHDEEFRNAVYNEVIPPLVEAASKFESVRS
jgi:hypothetical protein